MAKSKEKLMEIRTGKMSYCSKSNPADCRTHFHKEKLIVMKSPYGDTATYIDDAEANSNPLAEYEVVNIAGYSMVTLMNNYGISVDELVKIQSFPPAPHVSPMATGEKELFLAWTDRDRRKYIEPDVQAAIIVDKVKTMQPAFNAVRDELTAERANREYPGNADPMSELPKSRKYYELLSKQNEIMNEMAGYYQSAGAALGFDKSSNEYVANAMRIAPHATSTTERDANNITQTYWSPAFTPLINAVEATARQEHVKEAYEKEKNKFSNLVELKNDNIKATGSDSTNNVRPSEDLIRSRIEARMQESITRKTEQLVYDANLFNRKKRELELKVQGQRLEDKKRLLARQEQKG